MIKAVFFDIDGTLIPIGGNRMPQDTKDARTRDARRRERNFFILCNLL